MVMDEILTNTANDCKLLTVDISRSKFRHS